MNLWVIFSVIIASVILGIIIANLAKMRGYLEGRSSEKRRLRVAKPDESLTLAIYQEISKLSAPAHNQRQTAEVISNLFNAELSKKVGQLDQELNRAYEKVVNQAEKTADIFKKKYEKLSLEKKQTESVIRSIAEGLVVVNEKDEVLLMNPAAEKLLGVKKEEKIGKSILKDLKNEQLISLASTSGKGEKKGMEIELTSGEDETKKVLRASSAVIENEYGKTVGMVSVLSDVTKQRELEQMKSDFVSKVSHELRTPIVTVQNSISLLLSKAPGALSESQERFLNIAQRNLQRLGLLIDDLLDLSKLEASKMELKLAPCALEKVINEVCDTLVAWANSKNISIEKKIQQALPKLNLDYNRVIQVLNNIMGNAIKFTPREGKVVVQASLDEAQQFVLVSVTDTGVGIAQEDLDKVFDKFQQVGERASTDISGTGLGLSIAKELIELHGGKIWAESEKGQGAKFTFSLPAPGA